MFLELKGYGAEVGAAKWPGYTDQACLMMKQVRRAEWPTPTHIFHDSMSWTLTLAITFSPRWHSNKDIFHSSISLDCRISFNCKKCTFLHKNVDRHLNS